MPGSANLPSRLHHMAYTTKDMETTRKFYEEVIGLPLVATWSESDKLFGKVRTFPETPFHHIALKVDQATQEALEQRVEAAGFRTPRPLCWSTAIAARSTSRIRTAPGADRIARDRMADARATLARWLHGDHTSNNVYR
jgi:catechol 2,3-dioxygenase-like lactoylglutathione lyase family enzyme